jgi:hypothetical protein
MSLKETLTQLETRLSPMSRKAHEVLGLTRDCLGASRGDGSNDIEVIFCGLGADGQPEETPRDSWVLTGFTSPAIAAPEGLEGLTDALAAQVASPVIQLGTLKVILRDLARALQGADSVTPGIRIYEAFREPAIGHLAAMGDQ